MDNCIFCKIIQKKIPSTFVFENDDFVAIKDITPQAPVHLLLIPKKHVEAIMNISAADEKWWRQIPDIVQRLAGSQQVEQGGFRLVVNNGKDAQQTVPHLHFHFLGGRKMNWPPG
jgi:histidine triad (HIT) family protein